ncbi:hypothetical protein CDD82_4805 [Ophiocordyceps australis]|uniref:Translation initiation factor eIF2B subunit gamma n=1 Tax=Ophiocordyceps australis TaxID=1399860 RepID=A0A2C5Z170_9HYPO|nr:hypothetical protein CDD82_4805 [Ophiocordyceps australis]
MPHATSAASTGLQALILCGPGSSFPTFTSNPDDNPKALLPIANRPMVWYSIDFCLRMGISDITLICPSSALDALSTAFKMNPFLTSLPLPRPDILAPAQLNHNMGTAEILRLPEIQNLVTRDFVVLPCDLVCELAGDKLLQAWMVKSTSYTGLLGIKALANVSHVDQSGCLGVWYSTKQKPAVKGEETDFIAVAPLPCPPRPPPKASVLSGVAKLVYSMPMDSLNDMAQEKGTFPIRNVLLKAHPRVRMYTAHRDAHIYIFPRWVLDFVVKNERLESIGEDVVGCLAKAQWQRGLMAKLHMDTVCSNTAHDDSISTPESTHSPGVLSHFSPRGQELLHAATVENLRAQGMEAKSDGVEVPPVMAYVHANDAKAATPLIRRVDTAQLLLTVSLQIAKLASVDEVGAESASPFAHARKVAYPEGVKSRTTITKQDSLMGDNVTVEERVSIKESVVGAGCQIQQGAKLSQCLLMEGVVVGKNCKLTKCILGKRCVIGDNSVLTDCEVQENLLVEARTEDKDNKLMSSEGLEATDADIDEMMQDLDDESTAEQDG